MWLYQRNLLSCRFFGTSITTALFLVTSFLILSFVVLKLWYFTIQHYKNIFEIIPALNCDNTAIILSSVSEKEFCVPMEGTSLHQDVSCIAVTLLPNFQNSMYVGKSAKNNQRFSMY